MRYHHISWRHTAKAILFCGLAAYPWHDAHADAATEQQLRAALQQATTQIAQLQNQVANLQAQQAPDAAMIASLQAQLQTSKQQGGQAQGESAGNKEAADKQVEALNRQLAAQQANLGKLQTAYGQAAGIANSNAAANQRLSAQIKTLQSENESCNAKNAALYNTGNEILDQLSHRDNFFSSLASREPFIGVERVKLETIIQSDQDKLDDNQAVPAGGSQ